MHAGWMRLAALGVVLATVGGLQAAGAAASERLVADLKLTSHRPNQPTGGTLHLVWPKGEDGKPKTQRVGVFRLPAGTRVNESAIPACTATDAELFHPQGSDTPVIAVNRVDIKGSAFVARPALPPGWPPGTKTAPKQSDQE